jgi:hypothetical protein
MTSFDDEKAPASVRAFRVSKMRSDDGRETVSPRVLELSRVDARRSEPQMLESGPHALDPLPKPCERPIDEARSSVPERLPRAGYSPRRGGFEEIYGNTISPAASLSRRTGCRLTVFDITGRAMALGTMPANYREEQLMGEPRESMRLRM